MEADGGFAGRVDVGVQRYWTEPGTTLYFEKPPDKPFIPRRGESFTSVEVVKAEDCDALRSRLAEVAAALELNAATVHFAQSNWFLCLDGTHSQVNDETLLRWRTQAEEANRLYNSALAKGRL
jgi:hypothetical protein